MKNTKLEKLRKELGRKDLEILNLLNERARLVMEVGRVKHEDGTPIFDPSQESKVFSRLKESNEGPLPDTAVRHIFREIISASRSLQAPITVAYLGPEASFTHQAALAQFGRGTILLESRTISEVFKEVEGGEASLGVVPVENSLEGSVRETLDRLTTTPRAICSEVYLRISLCLLASHREKERIKKIYSHPHAFAECRGWLAASFPLCALEAMESTAAAARKALEDREGAAIAGVFAAEHYGMEILERGIEDHPENTTRFLVLGKGESEPTGNDKTSVLFTTPHLPGALFRALAPLAEREVNILSMESRPLQERMWEYLFFLDLEGHRKEDRVAGCLRDMTGLTAFIKILGSYPRGELP